MRKIASPSYHPVAHHVPLSEMIFVVGETDKHPTNHTDIADRVRKALKDQRSEGASHLVRCHRLVCWFYSCDPSGNEAGPYGGPHWRTAYETARLAVDIAKESSYMFPPLKAVVGALAVLIKNYDVKSNQLYRPIDR